MARIASARDSVLTRKEIAKEALRQFDHGPAEPTIRSLAKELRVVPAAIYYHYPSRAAVVHAVVERVWRESWRELQRLLSERRASDSVEVLVSIGLATRRAWLSHYRVGRYLAATPDANPVTAGSVELMANVLIGLGVEGEEAARAFHSFASFMVGAVLLAAERKAADEQLKLAGGERSGSEPVPRAAPGPSEPKPLSIEQIVDLSTADPALDEALFEDGLRRLIKSFSPADPPAESARA
jgi:TetR/AcrR family transcriptional regulator, tetracycline repressor protein